MAKGKYTPPYIERLSIEKRASNKYFDPEINYPKRLISENTILKLAKKYGSPLFILEQEILERQYRLFKEAFTVNKYKTIIGYSVKTNYLSAVCSILFNAGAYAEVVSGMEYNMVRALGLPASRIIFNGPYKQESEIELALSENAYIQVDGFDDLKKVESSARKLKKKAAIGIRISHKYKENSWTKFGFHYETKEPQRAIDLILKSNVLDLKGFHHHSGTFNIDPYFYVRSIEVIADLAKYARKKGAKPTIIDLGGGYPSSKKLKPSFDVPGGSHYDHTAPFIFAKAIVPKLEEVRELFAPDPTVIFEPGRILVDESMMMVCTVISSREIDKENRDIMLDAGVNVLPTSYWYQYIPRILNNETAHLSAESCSTVIYGPLCMQIDVISPELSLPALGVGTKLVFEHVGAYNITQSMQFIQPRPPVVLATNDSHQLVKVRETWQDVVHLDRPLKVNNGH